MIVDLLIEVVDNLVDGIVVGGGAYVGWKVAESNPPKKIYEKIKGTFSKKKEEEVSEEEVEELEEELQELKAKAKKGKRPPPAEACTA